MNGFLKAFGVVLGTVFVTLVTLGLLMLLYAAVIWAVKAVW